MFMTDIYIEFIDFRMFCRCARMSKITNDGLTRYGTECFIAVPSERQSVNCLSYADTEYD